MYEALPEGEGRGVGGPVSLVVCLNFKRSCVGSLSINVSRRCDRCYRKFKGRMSFVAISI